ncbi:MAG TPA: hypothetical protein VHG91_06225 [Longimicrobium sp.]|nr:hypothetical protein [Longimicrobium sp.]
MVSLNASPPVAVLRQALRGEAAASSLRNVSRQVGMSPTGLQKFLDGGHPYSVTRRKLERWYVLHGPGRHADGLAGSSAATILRVMVQDLPSGRQRPMLESLVASLEGAYAAAGLPRPGWLDDLRPELFPDDAG